MVGVWADFKATGGVTKVVGMDQTFIHFFPNESDAVMAPIGSDRVGSTVQADDKEGVTLAVTCELGKKNGVSYSPSKIGPGYWTRTRTGSAVGEELTQKKSELVFSHSYNFYFGHESTLGATIGAMAKFARVTNRHKISYTLTA
eukprot:COSAG01_NODE_9555_length_2410_cov_17.551709_2_plen_144_part_00